jgi:DegV family protein with EDD domain
MPNVAVVTDSAADLPADLARERGVSVVPLIVTFGEESFTDGVQLTAEGFWDRMERRGGLVPTTASPAPGILAEAYQRAADAGASGVVSIHLAGSVSSTAGTATAVGSKAPLPVRAVDSRMVGAGLGLVALAAASAARDGGSIEEVERAAREAMPRVELFAVLESVDLLRRGGRVGATKAIMSDLLRVRPVLSMADGAPTLVAKARTRSKAVDELLRRLDGPAVLAGLSHGRASDAEDVAGRISQACGVEPFVTLMGAALGAHLGPGALGVAVLRP